MDNSRKIVVTNHYDLWNYMFADLEKNNGAVEQYPFTSYGKSSKEQLLFRICNNRLAKSFLQNIWFKHILKRWKISSKENAKILFLSPSLPLLDVSFIKYLQKARIPFALLFIDTVQCMGEDWINKVRPYLELFWEKTYSYDEADAAAYHWIFTRKYYSKLDFPKADKNTDVFLTLYDKGRAVKALQCYDVLTSRGISCKFYITGVSDEFAEQNKRPGIVYNKILSYSEVIKFVVESRVIIELCQQGQTSNTLRAFEAVVYDNRLLTDNSNVVGFPYYDETKMKCFEEPEDLLQIPLEFFNGETSTYKYDGRFSPLELFKLM